MEIKKRRDACLKLPILMLAALLLVVLSGPNTALAAAYTDSAHGSASYGVNRPGVDDPTGDCGHCHETSDPAICGANAYMLFYGVHAICDLICYECHAGSGATEQQVVNYPYGILFGGLSTLYFESILAQFCSSETYYTNCGSRHSLARIWNTIKDDGYGWGFGADPNPCSACHSPHLAQRIGSTQHRPPYDPSRSPITRPSERYNNPGNLWGDDASERMNQYITLFADGAYQAPYYESFGSGQYEPAGDTVSDGSNLPDYVTFCLDCHQYAQYDPETGENVKAIDYANEAHGGAHSNTCTEMGIAEGTLRAPYNDFSNSNYVLSCLDCHEPHGTRNRLYLMRRMINGQIVAADTTPCDQVSDMAEVCGKCHEFTYDHLSWGGCTGCHGGTGSADWHGTTFPNGFNCVGLPSF